MKKSIQHLKYYLLFAIILGNTKMAFCLEDTIYIFRQTIEVNSLDISACSFNSSPAFSMQNAILNLSPGEILNLTVINNDTKSHTFVVDSQNLDNNEVLAGEAKAFEILFSTPGTFRFYSDEVYGQMIGASGMILVGFEGDYNYYWNLYDCEAQLSHSLSDETITEIPPDFQPNLFFINGNTFPNTLGDSLAYVEGQVGDEIIISIVNAGNMEHILHFHGYHVKILSCNINSHYVGWIKDSIPVKCGEAMTLRLVPDKAGTFPVHDHNLIAVTNAGFYPGGMITHLNIEP